MCIPVHVAKVNDPFFLIYQLKDLWGESTEGIKNVSNSRLQSTVRFFLQLKHNFTILYHKYYNKYKTK